MQSEKGDSVFEKYASQQAELAREGRGLIGGALASQRARTAAAREYAIATKGTMGKRQAIFEGLLGRDLGDTFKKLGLEKMESEERIKEARQKFGLDRKIKKEKVEGGGAGRFAKPISLILRNVIETKNIIKNIEKALAKPTLKPGYAFDPRMSGGGRYKNVETNKIVSAKEAMNPRTAALTSAIGADEEPLFKLREYIESKLKDFDAKRLKQATDDTVLSLNGLTPTGPVSIHDKLNILLAKAAMPGIGDIPGRRGPDGKKTPPTSKGGGALKKIGSAARVLGRVAGVAAVGLAAYDAYEGYNNAEQNLGLAEGQEATTGQKMASAAGGVVSGITFGLVDSGAAGKFFAGIEEDPMDADLKKYVRVKDSSVNLEGLKPEMKKRLAGMAYEYNQQTGQKIQINSGYRDPKEQAELYAKYGAPRAAPPGRSRHERGLAVDINSTDANKAIELGLMAKYGFTRPVRGETWHVEPIEVAKKGPTPDNPYAPGAPVVVANQGGKATTPETGKKPPQPMVAAAAPTPPPAPAPAAEDSSLNIGGVNATSMAAVETSRQELSDIGADAAIEDNQNISELKGVLTDGLVSIASGNRDLSSVKDSLVGMVQEKITSGLFNALMPKENTMGLDVARQSSELEASRMVAQATPPAPIVVNNNSGGGNQQPIQPPKSPLTKALARSAESAFNRAISKDFAHPTAFTSVGLT
jgi:hypothetical protein